MKKTIVLITARHHSGKSFFATEIQRLLKEKAEVYGLQSLACLFLSITEKNKGVLAVYSGDANAFDKHEIINLERIAQGLSYAIGSIRAYNESSLFKNELSQSQKKLLNQLKWK